MGGGWIRDVFWIALATALSRILGLVREIVIAGQFGASGVYDAYLIAFFIPHFLRRLLAEGALSSAFIPLYTERLRRDRNSADLFASNVISVALLVFPALILLGIWWAPFFVPFLADGFDQAQQELAIHLSRITFPFIGLMGLAAIVMGVLNSQKHFWVPALAPVLFNVGIIFSVLALRGLEAESLAVGVLLGGAAQLLIQLPLLKGRLRFRWRLDWRDPALRQMLGLLGPAMIGMAAVQINVMVDNKLASHLSEGSISALQYAIRLFHLPLGVFAVAISTAILPRLSAQNTKNPQALILLLRQGVLLCSLILLPATAGLWVLGQPAIRLLFEHGAFSAQDTLRTLNALQFYALGLLPYGLVTVLIRAFYALKDGRTPVVISVVVVVVNVVLALLLVGPMGVGGLALSTSMAGWVQLALTWLALVRRCKVGLLEGVRKLLLQATLAAILMGGGVWMSRVLLARWSGNEFLLVIAPAVLGIGLYGGLIYVFTGNRLSTLLAESREI